MILKTDELENLGQMELERLQSIDSKLSRILEHFCHIEAHKKNNEFTLKGDGFYCKECNNIKYCSAACSSSFIRVCDKYEKLLTSDLHNGQVVKCKECLKAGYEEIFSRSNIEQVNK